MCQEKLVQILVQKKNKKLVQVVLDKLLDNAIMDN